MSPQSCPVPLTLPVTVPGLKALLLSAVSVSGLMAAPAVAQTSPLVQFLGTIVLDPAFARARDPEGTAADRGNSHYVADAELERARTGDLRDLFSGIASVSVGGAIPIAQKIFVNGIDMLNLAVVMDGVSQNNRLFHHISANAFDPGLLRFVRVDAGAAPADLGPHAMAGAVVMETVDPVDFLDPDARFGGDVRLSFDSNGQTWGRAATLAGRMGALEWLEPSQAWSLSFGARWDRQDFVGTNGWEQSFSGLSGNLSVSYQATDALRLRGGISSVFGGVALEDNFIFNPG